MQFKVTCASVLNCTEKKTSPRFSVKQGLYQCEWLQCRQRWRLNKKKENGNTKDQPLRKWQTSSPSKITEIQYKEKIMSWLEIVPHSATVNTLISLLLIFKFCILLTVLSRISVQILLHFILYPDYILILIACEVYWRLIGLYCLATWLTLSCCRSLKKRPSCLHSRSSQAIVRL